MPFDYRQVGLGWNPDGEAVHAAQLAAMCSAPAPVTAPMPDDVDPPLPCNDQARFNSCEGNALAKCLEFDHLIDTGVWVKLSARFSYLTSKKADGTLNGPDAGATIGAGALAASRDGCCLEETFPYWQPGDRYSNQIPAVAYEQGKLHLAEGWCDIPSLDFSLDLIGSGQCATIFGAPWYESEAGFQTSDPNYVMKTVSGGVLGGHARCICGYKKIGGRRIPKVWNSHSADWGYQGTVLMDPDLLWWLISQGGFGARGVKRTPAFVERPVEKFIGV